MSTIDRSKTKHMLEILEKLLKDARVKKDNELISAILLPKAAILVLDEYYQRQTDKLT